MLTACYDLARSPPTYDFISFLLTAEIARKKMRQDAVQVLLLPGPAGGFRQDSLWPRSVATRQKLLQSIVLPMCELLPSLSQATVANGNTRIVEPSIGKSQRMYGTDLLIKAIVANGRPLRPKDEWPKNNHLVTITLRECEHWPERNSNVTEWTAAARIIRGMGYDVCFVRDTLHADEPIEDFQTDAKASSDLIARASLYRSAFCNLFVNNGPGWLSFALDAPTLMLKPTTEILGSVYSAAYLSRCGIPSGGQIPGCGSHQRIVWQEDNHGFIVEAFKNYLQSSNVH